MTTNHDVLRLVQGTTKKTGAGAGSSQPLTQAAMRLSEARENRSRFKARELVGLLLCHGARAWRASQSRVDIRLAVRSPSGPAAVRLKVTLG